MTTELKPRILVFGVGGAGGNAVNNMIEAQLQGVDFAVANTDAQALARSNADRKVQLGETVTQGLGAGARPEVGASAAEESHAEIDTILDGAHMVFIAAGMGGGTGTGAAPVIARRARDKGALTVGVVTKPFGFEGGKRMTLAEDGVEALREHVDTLIIVPNQNLFRIANEKTTFADAFQMADQVLYSGVRGITDLMVMPGLVNLDFADVRKVMGAMGAAMMGTGEANGDNRALEAAEAAISNPLLDDVSMKGAKGVLINITGGLDMTLFEVDEATKRISDEVDQDAEIIWGSSFDEALEGRLRVSVVATGIEPPRASARPSIMARPEPSENLERWRDALRKPEIIAPQPVEAEAEAPVVAQPEQEAPERPAVSAVVGKPLPKPIGRIDDSGEFVPEPAASDAMMADAPSSEPVMVEPEAKPPTPAKQKPALFGWRKQAESPARAEDFIAEEPMDAEDLSESTHPAAAARAAIEDVDLSIPAFLRRAR